MDEILKTMHELADEELDALVQYLEARKDSLTGRKTTGERAAQERARDRWRAARAKTIGFILAAKAK